MITAEFEKYYNRYTDYLEKPRRLIKENNLNEKNVGFFLGSFKPPHAGHFNAAAEGAIQTDEFHVIISPGFRGMTSEDQKLYSRAKGKRYRRKKHNREASDPSHKKYGQDLKPLRGINEIIKEMESRMIQPAQAKLIWDEYLSALPDHVQVHSVEGSGFVDPVKYTEKLILEYANSPEGEDIHIKLYIGEDDLEQGDPRNAPLKEIQGVGSVTEVPAARSHSATDARIAIVDGNKEAFNESQPDAPNINKDYIWDILSNDNVTY
jgi:nicotinamide mononucleotide adenylyltransferase